MTVEGSGRRTDADRGRGTVAAERADPGIRVLAAMAVRQQGKVLVMREEDEPFRRRWVLPEGDPRPGEALRDAAVREVAEELGLDVQPGALLGVYEEFSPDRTQHWVIVCFLARAARDAPPRPSREAIDYAWIDPATALPRSPRAIQRILADLARLRPSD